MVLEDKTPDRQNKELKQVQVKSLQIILPISPLTKTTYMDERFATPRASALSSRSNCSSSLATARSQGSDPTSEWHTPRHSVSSTRSAASFATARSTLQSPIETVQIFTSERDRSRDFRRFSDHPNSHKRPSTAMDQSSTFNYQRNYELAESGGVTEGRSRHASLNSNSTFRGQRNQDNFSLARHGRAVSMKGDLEYGI